MKDRESSELDPELDQLISGLIDETLSPEEEHQLAERLKADPQARQAYLEYAAIDGALHWDHAETATDDLRVVSMPKPAPKRRRVLRWSGIAAAAAIIVLVAGSLFVTRPAAAFLTVEFVDGGSYLETDSTMVTLTQGKKLSSGTLTIDNPSGSAELRYSDGTLITIGGESEVTFSLTESGKQIDVSTGQITASVAPQPASKPLRIRTFTAEVEVLGTILSVNAASDMTDLSVEEGLVRLRRLADGESVEVPAKHESFASLSSGKKLTVTQSIEPDTTWRIRPEEVTKAIVETGESGQPFYRTVPYKAGRSPEGRTIIRQGIAINGNLVKMTKDSVIRLRYRSNIGPAIFFSTRKSSGRFGGNFDRDLNKAEFPAGADGWREALIPISEFEPLRVFKDRGFSLENNRVTKILISSYGEQIEVESMSITVAN